jgi:hypothetical protein
MIGYRKKDHAPSEPTLKVQLQRLTDAGGWGGFMPP